MKTLSERIKEELTAMEVAGGINPYTVMDGKWGGFGQSLWVDAESYGYSKNDVLESEKDTLQWVKLWVNAEQKWRNLTETEIKTLG